jgi:hypothetical protein
VARIFISHIHEERKVAAALQKFLQEKLGEKESVFSSSDKGQIYAGEDWLQRIRKELRSAKVVILMMSPKSVSRPWVFFEAGAAWLKRGTVIIPVCYAGLLKKHLPKPYSDMQAVNLKIEPNYLLKSVAHHLGLSKPASIDRDCDVSFKKVLEAFRSMKSDILFHKG